MKTAKKAAIVVSFVVVGFVGMLQLAEPAGACAQWCDQICINDPGCVSDPIHCPCSDRSCHPEYPCYTTNCAAWCGGP